MRKNSFPAAGAAGLALSVLALAGCGGGGGGAASPTAPTAATAPVSTPATASVAVSIVSSIGNSAFVPNPVRANTGDSVTFRNTDSVVHRLLLEDGSDLGDLAPGASSRAVVLRNANPMQFRCTLHPSMVGTINGASAPEPTCVPDAYGYCP